MWSVLKRDLARFADWRWWWWPTLELWGKWRPRSADGVRMNNESGPCSDHGTGWTALVVVVVLVRLAMLVVVLVRLAMSVSELL